MRYTMADGLQQGPNMAMVAAERASYPVNLVESEVGSEVSELLSHRSLRLSSAHQTWLLMAILYLVERERIKAQREAGARPTICTVKAESFTLRR